MGIRALARDDRDATAQFVLMAAFPPGRELPHGALELSHARRWLVNWGDELGVAWEEAGELLGAAWARRVEPVLIRDATTKEPLPEVIISVVNRARGVGIGTELMQALLRRAQAAACPAALGKCQREELRCAAAVRAGRFPAPREDSKRPGHDGVASWLVKPSRAGLYDARPHA